MDVAQCMRTKLILVGKDCNFKTLICKLATPLPHQAYIVDDSYTLLGIVSAMDLLREIIPSYLNADLARSVTDECDFLQKRVEMVKDKRAEDIMVTKFSFVYPHHQLLEADILIAEKGINTLPVIDKHGKILGEITRRDILLQLISDCAEKDLKDRQLIDLAKPAPQNKMQ